ncbi:aldehyde dehydrogenase family protein [Plantactinospora sp. GCM10030261]|uniref:aldehyde dehydrogenase family protein n=1 Tax=Plantactinospora sp. GCM10030261 TaxID=3273420 RepID=UPI00361744B9
MTSRDRLLAGVRWELGAYLKDWTPAGGAKIDVTEPATGATLGSFAAATADVVAQAATVAAAGQPHWQDTHPADRARILNQAGDILERHSDEVVERIVRESGSAVPKAVGELAATVAELRSAAALSTQPAGRVLPAERPGQVSVASRVPIGVIGVITPWNVPLLLAARSVAPALALGNAVVLKPDPHTPACGGVLLVEALRAAGLPEGVLTLVLGGAETGEAVVTDPRVRMISFTGSTTAGRLIARLAGERLKKVALELGGNSPLIVLDDADLDRASSAGAWGSFQHQGQVCMATSRHLVHEKVADEYLDRLSRRAERLRIGDPASDPDVHLGPLINQRQLDRVDRIVSASVTAGATALTGGRHDGLFYRPTVLAGVTPAMPAYTEEIFGPVAPVTVFCDDEEALHLASMTEYGLAAAIHSTSQDRALRLAARIPAGMVHVNDQTVNDNPYAPFGGRGASGNGSRFGGEANWEAFTQWQWLTVASQPPIFPF